MLDNMHNVDADLNEQNVEIEEQLHTPSFERRGIEEETALTPRPFRLTRHARLSI